MFVILNDKRKSMASELMSKEMIEVLYQVLQISVDINWLDLIRAAFFEKFKSLAVFEEMKKKLRKGV